MNLKTKKLLGGLALGIIALSSILFIKSQHQEINQLKVAVIKAQVCVDGFSMSKVVRPALADIEEVANVYDVLVKCSRN